MSAHPSHKWTSGRRDVLVLEGAPPYRGSSGTPVVNEIRCVWCGLIVRVRDQGRGWGRESRAHVLRRAPWSCEWIREQAVLTVLDC